MSGDSPEQRMAVEIYGRLRAQLAAAPDDRAERLAEHGLDEESWDELDDAWQNKLSDDLEADEEDVPESVVKYSQAFAAAQREIPGETLPLERFAEALRAVQRGPDPTKALARIGVTMGQFLKANQIWAPLLATDRELAERFARTLEK